MPPVEKNILIGANMGVSNQRDAYGISLIFGAILFLFFGGCLFISGCRATPHWSAEAISPDGKMIATAKANANNNGPGTNDPGGTTVYLNWAPGSQQPPTEIFEFYDNLVDPSGMNVGMKWLTPSHLELTYKGSMVITFQAIKWNNVDITVRDLSNK